MKAVLFYNHLNSVNGAVIDVIEYFLALLDQNKNVKLLVINYNYKFKSIIENLIKDRYIIDNLNFKDNIININKGNLLHYKFDRLLILDYTTLYRVKGLIRIKNDKSKIIILSDLHTDNKKYVISKKLYPDGCVNYYGEMPFVYKDHQYNMKFLFSRYKMIKNAKETILLHSPENIDYSFIPNLNLPNKPIIYKTGQHKQNLFELFDTFVYYHANKWYDPRPRLMHECAFYNKKIIYFNNTNVIDGSYYRYKDLILNGLKNRWLNGDDEVIKEFI